MSSSESMPGMPTREECRAFAKLYSGKLSFDDVIRPEAGAASIALAFGHMIKFPVWSTERFIDDREVALLLRELDLNDLSGNALKEVEDEITHSGGDESEFYWKLDCILAEPEEFPAASAQIKNYFFARLRKRFEREFAVAIYQTCRQQATSHGNLAK